MEGHERINKRIITALYLCPQVESLIYRLTSKNVNAWRIFSFYKSVKWSKYKLALTLLLRKVRDCPHKTNDSISPLFHWLEDCMFMFTWQRPLVATWITSLVCLRQRWMYRDVLIAPLNNIGLFFSMIAITLCFQMILLNCSVGGWNWWNKWTHSLVSFAELAQLDYKIKILF